MKRPAVPFFSRLSPASKRNPAAVRAAFAPRYAAGGSLALHEEVTEFTRHEPASPAAAAHQGAPLQDRATTPLAPQPLRALERRGEAGEPRATPRRAARPDRFEIHHFADRLEMPAAASPETPDIASGEAGDLDAKPQPSPAKPLSRHEDARAPLGREIVTQRILETSAKVPDIVEVTIDRIDVRLPDGSSPPRNREGPRPRPSTISLSEYLRQRSGSRGST
jgi:hypothetical protein